MAIDPLAKVLPGDALKIPAKAYNAFVDAAQSQQGLKNQGPERKPIREQLAGIVRIRNDSGADITRFGVLGVDGPIYTPSDSIDAFKSHTQTLKGSTPIAGTHEGKFAIAIEPIAAGAIGRACISGLCAAQVQFLTDAPPVLRFAEIVDAQTTLLRAKDTGAATILWHESIPGGGGTVWSLVRLGGLRTPAIVSAVLLIQAGGVQGTATTPATWTYNVFNAVTLEQLNQVGVPVDPTATPHAWRRSAIGSMAPATMGHVFLTVSGVFVVTWTNETLDLEACV